MTFGEMLYTKRLQHQWSLREAAANIGISHTYLAALEKDADPRTGKPLIPTPDSILKLCKAYDIPYTDLSIFNFLNENELDSFIITQMRRIRIEDKKRFTELMARIEDETILY